MILAVRERPDCPGFGGAEAKFPGVRLFTDLLETSVFASVGARARIDGGITVTYIGEVNDHDATVVMTTLLTRSGRELSIGYGMALQPGGWVVHDVVVDGVSLVENYRAQFQKVMQRSSYAATGIAAMRTPEWTAPAPPPRRGAAPRGWPPAGRVPGAGAPWPARAGRHEIA